MFWRGNQFIQKGSEKYPAIISEVNSGFYGSGAQFGSNVSHKILTQRTDAIAMNDTITDHLSRSYTVVGVESVPNGYMRIDAVRG